MQKKSNQVILFLTNKSSKDVLDSYDKLVLDAESNFDIIILYHQTIPEIPNEIKTRPHFVFTDNNIYDDLGFPVYCGRIFFNGCGHFPLFWFMKNNPDYEHYWVIEDDVRFTGNWMTLFGHMPYDYDFISSHLRLESRDSGWAWINSFLYENGQEVPDNEYQKVASFNTIYRLSNKAMKYLAEKYSIDKYRGHHELTMATLLYNNNFKIGDFGPVGGNFMIPNLPYPYYTADTNRFRPIFVNLNELVELNTIYHPIKFE